MTLAFTAGFVPITPTRPLPLAGYSARTDACAGIADELEANVLILRGDDGLAILVSFDLLYVGADLRRRLEDALKTLVGPERLFLAASHTHFAPATDPTLPKLGAVDSDYVARIVAQVVGLVHKLKDGPFKPACIHVGRSQANHAVNRRWVGWRPTRRYPFIQHGAWMRPNPAGIKDETVRVLRIDAGRGTSVPPVAAQAGRLCHGDALIWNYACHPVFTPRMNHVSADFVGVVRRALRQQLGSEAAVLFWQGLSGDVYPSFAGKLDSWSARLRRRLFGGETAIAAHVYQHWANGLADHVATACRTATPRRSGPIGAIRSACPVSDLLQAGTSEKLLTAHCLRIGPDLNVLGVSAEPVTAYGTICRQLLGSDDLLCVGCTDGVFGYLATGAMLREGGYEAGDFMPPFSMQGAFRSDLEQIVQARLLAPLLDEPKVSATGRGVAQFAK